MKRSQIVFVTVVFTALLAGILVERVRREAPLQELSLRPPMAVPLEPLEAPRGEQVVVGRVTTPDGSDLAEVLVHAYPVNAPRRAEPIAWTVTDPEGRFVLTELFEGAHRVELWQTGRDVASFAVEVPVEGEVIWQLGAPRPPLEVLPELVRAPIAGVVRDDLGHPLAGHEVALWPAADTPPLSGAVVRRATTDEEGRFAFPDLAVARYRVGLLPDWARGGSWPLLLTSELEHAAPADDAPLTLSFDGASVGGQLFDLRGRPVQGALVQLGSADDEDRVWPAIATDDQGLFRLAGLPPGRFVVRIRAGKAAVERTIELVAGEILELDLLPVEPRPETSGDG